MTEIVGKVALVTGGGSGIGRGLALALAEEGASVVVADIVQGRADEVADEVRNGGGTAIGIAGDVSKREDVRRMKAEANDSLGTVSLLFANAGVTWFDRLVDMKDVDVDWIMHVNLMGVIYCVQEFLPDIIAAGDGHVVATASNAGLIAGWVPDHVPYSAAKLGVIGFMLALRQELVSDGVGSTVYCPGGVRGRIGESFALRPEQFGGPIEKEVTLDREWASKNLHGFFDASEVAPMVLDAVKRDAPVVVDHADQRTHWMEWYVQPVQAAFEAAETWEQSRVAAGLIDRSGTMSEDRAPKYVVITSDCHAGAELHAYRPYLVESLHDSFDDWASTYTDGWSELDKNPLDTDDEHVRIGVASFMSPYNWDTPKRVEHLEAEGIAAEVVFPNTVPPFYPCSVIGAPGPGTPEEYRLRWAGVQAHNRWLVDFCAELPGRRAGLAQVFLDDIDDAVAEVRWAKEQGLAGVLIPHDHLKKLVPLYESRLDPFWAVCVELDLPVHRHAIVVGDSEAAEGAAYGPAIGMLEAPFFAERGFGHLVLAGVLKRFPTLKFVFTETGNDWVPRSLRRFDAWVREGGTDGSMLHPFAGNAVNDLDLLPSEYFRRNCYIGASLMSKAFVDMRDIVGVDRIMWGGDYPHHEGTWPHTEVALRWNFAHVPEPEVRAMTSGVAADVYGFDLGFLQTVADRIGPSVGRIATPITVDEVPRNTMSPTFVEAEHALARA